MATYGTAYARYCLEGEGTVEDLGTDMVHKLRPGTLYAMNNHDRYRITAITKMRVIATFTPPRTGREPREEDGSLS